MFKIKGGYELELQTHEITKLFEHKQINRQNKKWRKCTESWSGWSSFSTMQFSRQPTSTKMKCYTLSLLINLIF